jgi:hypothetical protein
MEHGLPARGAKDGVAWYETNNIAVETMLMITAMTSHSRPHVVMARGGIGGLFAAKNSACSWPVTTSRRAGYQLTREHLRG